MITSQPTLSFAAPELENIDQIREFIAPFFGGSMSCESSPVILLLWKDLYHQQVAFFEDMLFIRFGENANTYLLPFAKDMEKAIFILKAHSSTEGRPLTLFAAQGERLSQFMQLFGQKVFMEPSRDDFEYLYRVEALKTLSGKKYHSKRNHIAAFSRQYAWQYETLSQSNLEEVFAMADLWMADTLAQGEDPQSVQVENAAIKRVLPHMEQLGIKGGLIRVEGKVVAFCFGSAIHPQVFDLHVEKALPDYRTAYSVINREFVANELGQFTYVNREDDMGLEGLRRAKLSYHPDILLEKYVIRIKDE